MKDISKGQRKVPGWTLGSQTFQDYNVITAGICTFAWYSVKHQTEDEPFVYLQKLFH